MKVFIIVIILTHDGAAKIQFLSAPCGNFCVGHSHSPQQASKAINAAVLLKKWNRAKKITKKTGQWLKSHDLPAVLIVHTKSIKCMSQVWLGPIALWSTQPNILVLMVHLPHLTVPRDWIISTYCLKIIIENCSWYLFPRNTCWHCKCYCVHDSNRLGGQIDLNRFSWLPIDFDLSGCLQSRCHQCVHVYE